MSRPAEGEEWEAQWRERYGKEPTVPGSTVSVFSPDLGVLWVLGPTFRWAIVTITVSAFEYSWADVCSALDSGLPEQSITVSIPREGV